MHHTNTMIYVFSLVTGVINGLFASGAGQILVFFLIYIARIDTHKARATSMLCTTIATAFSLAMYIKWIKLDILQIIIVLLCGMVFGAVGASLMKKMNALVLNLASGIIILGLSLYNIVSRLV